jgi:uncharacterized protein YlzI (FlbEa/FlbD family)
MLLAFEDAETGNQFWVNPTQVAVVFQSKTESGVQVTAINLLNGNVVTTEDILSVIGKIQGELRGQ